ncbi:MAG TPA: hypothetical protein VJQ55_01670 [Candidatus Binatia bacterium]|nr:hypothetical protein [Candidatus Binatia bacterium]
MMKKTLIVGLLTAGLLTGAAAAPKFAAAHDYYGRGRYQNYRSEWGEVRRDRQELWRDQAELARDRADLQRMYRYGASRAAIDRKRAEIRNDWREVRRSQEELSDSYADLRNDRYRYSSGYNRYPGWWGGWWNR